MLTSEDLNRRPPPPPRRSTGATDPFTGRLLRLHAANTPPVQPLRLGVHRNDYMLDTRSGAYRQVEINTVAASFGAMSSRVTRLHRYLVAQHGSRVAPGEHAADAARIPLTATQRIPAALAAAVRKYGEVRPGGVPARRPLAVLVVVQPGERNRYDIQGFVDALVLDHGVPVLLRTLAYLNEHASLADDGSKALWVDGREVAVVYFRAGYTPNDYPSEAEWEARERIEATLAIKCPSVAYHLVGTKKVQQLLAGPGVLERFLPDADEAKRVRATFAGLYSLEPEDAGQEAVDEIVAKALAAPGDYVLKPQREGGGNNLYDEDLRKALERMSATERSSYVLMDRLHPAQFQGRIMRNGQATPPVAMVYELGIYGTYLAGDAPEPHLCEAAGHLLRSKAANENDGGVAAGVAVLDTPYLVDDHLVI